MADHIYDLTRVGGGGFNLDSEPGVQLAHQVVFGTTTKNPCRPKSAFGRKVRRFAFIFKSNLVNRQSVKEDGEGGGGGGVEVENSFSLPKRG